MAVETSSRPTFLASLSVLVYFSTVTGIIPYSIRAYSRHRVLQSSVLSNVFVSLMAVQAVVQYHFASSAFSMGDKKESGTLTVIIGYVIIYMEPVMLTFDVLGFLVHQRLLVRLVAQMQYVDDQLARQHVHISYACIRRLTVVLLVIVTVVELSIVTYNFVLFQEAVIESLWWFITCLPLYFSSVAKIWFILLMTNVKMKFGAINGHMQDTVRHYMALREKQRQKEADADRGNSNNGSAVTVQHMGFIHEEIGGGKRRPRPPAGRQANIFTLPSKPFGIVQVQPAATSNNVAFERTAGVEAGTTDSGPDFGATWANAPPDREHLNRRLTALCQLHDEICDIGKGINRLFSFQMLILMAYGFMSLTAKLYFVYCGMTSQNIPILFRSAESLPISVTFIVYTGAKCVYVIYISWQTKLTAQKTGVMLHKVANVVDENDCYVVVNHLSLKLLNHHLTFTACGFFDLDMTTLYAITGAITSYLIILIQFNLAAQRNKKPRDGLNSTAIAVLSNSTLAEDRGTLLDLD